MSSRVRPSAGPVPAPPSTVETIAAAYLHAAGQDPHAAIRRVIADALVDLCEAERRTLRLARLRARMGEPGGRLIRAVHVLAWSRCLHGNQRPFARKAPDVRETPWRVGLFSAIRDG